MASAIQNKSDVEHNLQELIALFETMSGSRVANLRGDYGGEYDCTPDEFQLNLVVVPFSIVALPLP